MMAALALAIAALSAAPDSGYTVRPAAHSKEKLMAGDQAAWARAGRVRWGPARYVTAFQALHSPAGLYLRFEAQDDNPWSTLTKRDEHLWEEEVVEIFLDPDRSGKNYAEIEISPANVVCDVRMLSPWPDKKPDFDWNFEGIETRVLKGKGQWTALAFLPWDGFRSLKPGSPLQMPPPAGTRWRFNLFRVERPGGKEASGRGVIEAAWSPTGSESFHVPKAFRDLVFAP